MRLRLGIILFELGIFGGIIYLYIIYWQILGKLMPLFSVQNLIPTILGGLMIAIAIYKFWTFYQLTSQKNLLHHQTSTIIDSDQLSGINHQLQIGSWLPTTVRIQLVVSIVAFLYILSWNTAFPIFPNPFIPVIIDLLIFLSAIATYLYIRTLKREQWIKAK
jgi:hypothetical protein